MKPVVNLDGSRINTVDDFHHQIAKVMDFPDYYGKNLDALWDCLTGDVDADVRLVWKQHHLSKTNLGDGFGKIIRIFEDLKAECPGFELELD